LVEILIGFCLQFTQALRWTPPTHPGAMVMSRVYLQVDTTNTPKYCGHEVGLSLDRHHQQSKVLWS